MKKWNYFRGVITEILSIMLCILLYPFKSPWLRRPTADDLNKPDILCVHGYIHNETPWAWFRRQLRKEGVGVVNTVYYPSIIHDIPYAAVKVKERIEQYKKATGRDINILIGHSEGGLVSLEYALEHAPKDQIIHVIALGSPFHGTYVAKIGIGPGTRQMEIGSEYLRSLQDRLLKAEHIRLYAMCTLVDLIVVPPNSALMKEWKYAENVEFDDLGHVAFLFSPRVVRKVIDYLRRHDLL